MQMSVSYDGLLFVIADRIGLWCGISDTQRQFSDKTERGGITFRLFWPTACIPSG